MSISGIQTDHHFIVVDHLSVSVILGRDFLTKYGLGLANFYCCFVPRIANITAPLTELTGSKVVFKWEDGHVKAFKTLKQSLSSSYPKTGGTFILATYASDVGLGVVLSTTNGAVVEYGILSHV